MCQCQVCGAFGPTKKVLFIQHIGAIILMFNKHISGYMCRKCIDKYFWEYTLMTLFLGWWGMVSLFLTPCFLIFNTIRYLMTLGMPKEVRTVTAQYPVGYSQQ